MNIPSKQNIVLISGKAGVGKSSFAIACDGICKHMNFQSKILAFADELKKIAVSLGWDKKKDAKGRTFLIELGKAARNYDINVWAKNLFDSVDEYTDFVFVDDWRFVNEYEYFKMIEGYEFSDIKLYSVRIESPERESLKDSELYKDESETGLDKFDKALYNYIIVNDGTLEDLYNKALEVMTDINKNLKIW